VSGWQGVLDSEQARPRHSSDACLLAVRAVERTVALYHGFRALYLRFGSGSLEFGVAAAILDDDDMAGKS
jgi:hypothetical protein